MKILLVAAGLVVVAGLALSASLVPAAHVTPLSMSVGARGVPVTTVQVPVPALGASAVAKPASVNSITRSADSPAEIAPPVVAAPAPITSGGGSGPGSDGMGPSIVQVPAVCPPGHGDKKPCRPRPVPLPASDD